MSTSTPVIELPGHLALPLEGTISLLADFDNASNRGVVLYIVNRSGSDISIPTQDGDVYAKLETRVTSSADDDEDQWRRAQKHWYGWCGMSYYSRTITNESFITAVGYAPGKGELGRVRYRLYNEVDSLRLTSNEGTGLVDSEDLTAARNDSMAIRHGDIDIDIVKDVLTRLKPDSIFDLSISDEIEKQRKTAAINKLRQLGYDGDKEFMFKAVNLNWRALEYASEDLKDDKEIVAVAMKQDVRALHYASENLKNDKELVIEAVKAIGSMLAVASKSLKDDKEIVFEAVKQDPDALKYASENLKNDKGIVAEKRGGINVL